DVGDRLQLREREEAARPLDRVNRAEHARQQLVRVGFLLERDQVTVEAVQVLVALHEELLDDLVNAVHSRPHFVMPELRACTEVRCARSHIDPAYGYLRRTPPGRCPTSGLILQKDDPQEEERRPPPARVAQTFAPAGRSARPARPIAS